MNLNAALQGLRGSKPSITTESLFAYRLKGEDEVDMEAELPEIEHVTFSFPNTEHITCDEVNRLTRCLTPLCFLNQWGVIKAQRLGSWPIPGWHTYMIQTRALDVLNKRFEGQPFHDTFVKEVYTPQAGKCYYLEQPGDNEKKTLRSCSYCPGITCHCGNPQETIPLPPVKRRMRWDSEVMDQVVWTAPGMACGMSSGTVAERDAAFKRYEEDSVKCVEDEYEVTPWQEMEED